MATTPEGRPRSGDQREKQVQQIFSEIAPRYDLLNHVLSLNIDRAWRRRAVAALGWHGQAGGEYLDACAGTFDLSLELAAQQGFGGRVIATDFAYPMLRAGHGKLGSHPVAPICADSLELPFASGTFHGTTVGFGVRNLSDLPLGLREFHRVLKVGGRLVILEFTVPPNPLMRAGYMFYFRKVLPVIGRLVSGHPWAYDYLPESVREFPGPERLDEMLKEAGFAQTTWRLLSWGIAALHVAHKK